MTEQNDLHNAASDAGFDPNVSELNAAARLEASNETSAVLDKLHVEEIDKLLENLAQLEMRASSAPWREPGASGAVVNDDTVEIGTWVFYGGNPIFEACKPEDREFLIALRNQARHLIRQAQNWKKTFAELDEVHRVLGTNYTQHAGNAVQVLKDEVWHLLNRIKKLHQEAWVRQDEVANKVQTVIFSRDEAIRDRAIAEAHQEKLLKENADLKKIVEIGERQNTRNIQLGDEQIVKLEEKIKRMEEELACLYRQSLYLNPQKLKSLQQENDDLKGRLIAACDRANKAELQVSGMKQVLGYGV